MQAILFDREGTLNTEPYDEVVDSVDKMWILPDAASAMQTFGQLNYKLFIVTMQPGIANGRLTPTSFQQINDHLLEQITQNGAKIEKTYVCPHGPVDNCDCRKPKTGLITKALSEYPDLDISASWVIGDKLVDIGLGKAVGARTILINRDGKYTDDTADYVVPNLNEAAKVVSSAF